MEPPRVSHVEHFLEDLSRPHNHAITYAADKGTVQYCPILVKDAKNVDLRLV